MALEDFDAAIKLQPDDVETILNRGYTKINMDDPDGAIEDFDLCLSKQANYMKAFKYKAVALIKKEIYKQAIELLDKVLADNPSDRKSFYYRGIAKVYDGQIPDGCADLQTAIAMGNTDGVRIVEQYCGG